MAFLFLLIAFLYFISAPFLLLYYFKAKKNMKNLMEEDNPNNVILFKNYYTRYKKFFRFSMKTRVQYENTIARWEKEIA